ncbi:MAG: RsmD family RNA methyltransferase [Planctomycetes bacterium]|nr:RsmD family RNA methyltransferase [Planctomycetota bacterium]MCC7169096.1 RsmD family RNA methyltransferase [Planctomycetota bacterium]
MTRRSNDDHSPRILGGHARGRALTAPAGLATRPLRALVRRSLFDMLGPRIEGSTFLDLYAGAGTVGFEAYSRGATRVVLVERDRAALAALRRSVADLDAEPVVTIEANPVEEFVATAPAQAFDVVYLGPPYPLFLSADAGLFERVLPRVERLLNTGGMVVVESPPGFSPSLEGLSAERFREYGETVLHFLGRA